MYDVNLRKKGISHPLFMKVISFIFVFLLIGSCYSVSAAPTKEKQGFVEFKTEASINFMETIEVVLTDQKTGYYYTHHLYRENDYQSNFSVPFGTYMVKATAVTEMDEEDSQFSVSSDKAEIIVKSEKIAVPISLKVEVLTGIDVNSQSTTQEKIHSFISSVESEAAALDAAANADATESSNPKDETIDREETSSEEPEETDVRGFDKNNDLLSDTVGLLIAVALLFAVYAFIKYRRKSKEELRK